jgi:2,3-bisphosphoglycerate-independent phosphoglycerate mutase
MQQSRIKVLMDAGADINHRDKKGLTALKYARDNNLDDVAQLVVNP